MLCASHKFLKLIHIIEYMGPVHKCMNITIMFLCVYLCVFYVYKQRVPPPGQSVWWKGLTLFRYPNKCTGEGPEQTSSNRFHSLFVWRSEETCVYGLYAWSCFSRNLMQLGTWPFYCLDESALEDSICQSDMCCLCSPFAHRRGCIICQEIISHSKLGLRTSAIRNGFSPTYLW